MPEMKQSESQSAEEIKLFLAVATALGAIVLTSMTFFHFVEGWGWFDALYYTIVTMATVGYGDFVPVTVLGKVGAIFLIIFGFGMFGVFISLLLKRQRYKYQSRIDKES
jgi:voltage-gated potassium channel